MAIDQWTGAYAVALQRAQHLSIEQFARKLGLSVRGVAEWHRRPAMLPTKTTQQILDEELGRVSAEIRARFDRHVSGVINADETSATARHTPDSDRPQVPVSTIVGDLANAFRGNQSDGAAGAARILRATNDLRRDFEDLLWDTDAPQSRLECIEEGVAVHACDALVVAPLEMTCRIALDLTEVRQLAKQSQTDSGRLKAKRIAARLAVIMADEMSMLGEVNEARSWYSAAIAAADAVGDDALRADVRALAAMLPMYHGAPEIVVSLTDEALALATGKTCLASSLSAALNGFAWAKIGNSDRATLSLNIARSAHEKMAESCRAESMFGFSTRRRLFYESRALTLLGKYEDAATVQRQALDLYPPHVVGDRALIVIDQARALVSTDEHEAGAELAASTLENLPPQHRTRLFLDAASSVMDSVPPHARKLPGVVASRETIRELARDYSDGE